VGFQVILVLVMALLLLLLIASRAEAALVTFGNSLSGTIDPGLRYTDGFIIGVPAYQVPQNGYVVRWRMRSLDPVTGLQLKVLRAAGGSNYTVVGQSRSGRFPGRPLHAGHGACG
jgi:hypothetical protein